MDAGRFSAYMSLPLHKTTERQERGTYLARVGDVAVHEQEP